MKIEAEVPAPFHLMAAESAGPTKDGNYTWRAYVRQPHLGQFRGGAGFSLQEAVDKATKNLRDALAKQEALRPESPVAGLKLNLAALRLKGD